MGADQARVAENPSRRGRKPGVDLREVLNASRQMAPGAGGWRMLPMRFGPCTGGSVGSCAARFSVRSTKWR